MREGEGGKNVEIYLVKRQQRGREGGHKIVKMARRCLWMAPYVTEKLSIEETEFLGTLTFDTLSFGHIDF